MKIKNVEGLTTDQINKELQNGGKFVLYQYTISIIVLTFKRSSNIYFIRGGENAAAKGIPYSLISLFFGWWGIPWGPIYTIGSLFNNLGGGKDVTAEVLHSANQSGQVHQAA